MAISVVGTQQTGTNINGSDVTLTFDGSPAQDDVAIVVGGHSDDDSTDDSGVSSGPTGYTQISYLRIDTGTENLSFGAWYKVMGATPDTTVVCEGGSGPTHASAYASWMLRGVDTGTVEDVADQTQEDGNSSYDGPSITPVTNGAWVFSVVATNAPNNAQPTALTGYSDVWGVAVVDTQRFLFGAGYKVIDPATAEDPPAWTANSSPTNEGEITFAIRPAAAASNTRRYSLMTTGVG